MAIIQKLCQLLNRVFDKDPAQFLALRLRYSGGMSWTVTDGVLTTTVSGGPGATLSVDLSQYTIAQLVGYLAAQPGYSVAYIVPGNQAQLSALVLIDGAGDTAQVNGDCLYGFSSMLWAFLGAWGRELIAARQAVEQLPAQMVIPTASDPWLDYLGSVYGISRNVGEMTTDYANRIISTILKPRSNNVAIEDAVSKAFGGISVTVTDVVEISGHPQYNGSLQYNGTSQFNGTYNAAYNLFDVVYSYDLLGGADVSQFAAAVTDLVQTLRAAGTYLRSIAMQGGNLSDTLSAPAEVAGLLAALSLTLIDSLTAPTENLSAMALRLGAFTDSLTAPSDAGTTSMSVSYNTTYNGQRYFNGIMRYQSGQTIPETLS